MAIATYLTSTYLNNYAITCRNSVDKTVKVFLYSVDKTVKVFLYSVDKTVKVFLYSVVRMD